VVLSLHISCWKTCLVLMQCSAA